MKRKTFLIVSAFCLTLLFGFANAQECTIGNYNFTWYAAKAGDVGMDVQKTPDGVFIVLSSPGGGLARLNMTPSQAIAVSGALEKTGEYYDEQMKAQDPNMEKQLSAGDHTITFSSSRGRNFKVSVRKSALGAMVAMDKDQALKMAKYLKDAEKMAKVVNERIKP